MVRSMFAGVAGLKAHQSRMDVIGNNIANVNTWGYKAGTMSFKDAVYSTLSAATTSSQMNGGYGGTNPSQVGYGVNVGSISYDYSPGGYSPSSSLMDCMIDGAGFFIVGTYRDEAIEMDDDGDLKSTGLQLSRVGKFNVDGSGFLVDDNGNYIYGSRCTTQPEGDTEAAFGDDELTTIQLPGEGADLGGFTLEEGEAWLSYSLKDDGTVVATTTDKRTCILGKVKLAAVQNPNGLSKDIGYNYDMTDNCGDVRVVAAGGAAGRLKVGALEMATVDLATEFTNLITTQRGYQANSKIITVTDTMLEELVNLKR